MAELILPITFEDIRDEFKDDDVNAKLMQFVEPISHLEAEINYISHEIRSSGKLVFVLGKPGTGKSTFIQSLSWRSHIRIRSMHQIDANEFCEDGSLDKLFKAISSYRSESVDLKDAGPTCIVINYLENVVEYEDGVVKGFFRKLNGLLRNAPMLIIWPVTERSDVDQMKGYAADVSDTLFCRDKSVLNFAGPAFERYVDIVRRTISVLNNGRELSDFSLTTDDLEEEYQHFSCLPLAQRTMREFVQAVKQRWRKNTDYQGKISSNIPKSTEVWFVFSYNGAESIVAQFVRKSHRFEDSWSAIHDKLYEYIHDNQRSSVWDAKRLQLALYGAIKTRIMFLPTNTLVSCMAAYSNNAALKTIIDSEGFPEAWKKKKNAKSTLINTPMYKQLVGEPYPVGKRKGGPAAEALKKAEPIFAETVKWISSGGGSDKEINKSVAAALADCCAFKIESEKSHPWIPNITPDIFIDMPNLQVCVEFHHTNRDEPGVVADYVLKKLDIYMNQIKSLIEERV